MLLTTTALATLLSTGAMAQDTTTTTTTPAPATETTTPMANTGRNPIVMSEGYAAVDGDNLASKIIGAEVFTSGAADAEKIGNINDFVVDGNGDIAAAVIGVGGFIGIGEKNVAVNFSDLQWVAGPNNDMRYVLPTTADALTTAPDFVYNDDTAADQAANMDNNAMATDPNMTTDQPATDTAMAPNTDSTMAPATDTTMAPNADTTMAPANDTMAANGMDRSTMTNVDIGSMTTDDLKGTAVYGMNNEQIGTIGDFVLGTDQKVDAVIVDVGGFLGIGTKPVAVGLDNLAISQDTNNTRYLFLNTTKEQLEAQPQYNRDTYTAERDTQRMVMTP